MINLFKFVDWCLAMLDFKILRFFIQMRGCLREEETNEQKKRIEIL